MIFRLPRSVPTRAMENKVAKSVQILFLQMNSNNVVLDFQKYVVHLTLNGLGD